MKKISLILPLLFAVIFTSCSGGFQIEKKRYSNGFYVHRSGEKNTAPALAHDPVAASPEIISAATTAPTSGINSTNEAFIPGSNTAATAAPSENKSADQQPGIEEQKNHAVTKHTAINNITRLQQKEVPAPVDEQTQMIIMIILAIILSPIAVYLKEGITNRFWLDLICWCLGGGLFFTPFFYGGALLLFAMVFALLIVLDMI